MSLKDTLQSTIKALRRFHVLLSTLTILALLYDLGFPHTDKDDFWLNLIYTITLSAAVLSIISRYVKSKLGLRYEVFLFDLFSVSFFIILIGDFTQLFEFPYVTKLFHAEGWRIFALFLVFIRELAALKIDFKRTVLNPAQLFIVSFIVIILIGALVLMLPKATHNGISFIDAIFTSTSAVCVTGLIVVDTGSYFTQFGQLSILVFIQLGGLGIMTFASYFSYFFQGGSSYENQLALSQMNNSDKLGEVFSTLKKIILITFIIEVTGAFAIYQTLNNISFESSADKIFFSLFHAVSGFCNAGFSTLPNSLYEPFFRFNYPLHLILSALFIIGGIGFPIVFNLANYIRHLVIKWIYRLFRNSRGYSRPWVINLNTRIVLITTGILITLSTLFTFLIEYNNTLAVHDLGGKIVTAFFNATTTRTAGFNSINMADMHLATIMIFILMMWIGASPASTGGGIKTSTVAVAFLNFISLAKGKERIEIYRREIADISVRRSFAIISLSLIVVGLATCILVSIEPELGLKEVVFECFSAYSTVGLSLGVTAKFGTISKVVLMVVMFIGRVSMLSILIALMKHVRYKNYRYPTETILIN